MKLTKFQKHMQKVKKIYRMSPFFREIYEMLFHNYFFNIPEKGLSKFKDAISLFMDNGLEQVLFQLGVNEAVEQLAEIFATCYVKDFDTIKGQLRAYMEISRDILLGQSQFEVCCWDPKSDEKHGVIRARIHLFRYHFAESILDIIEDHENGETDVNE